MHMGLINPAPIPGVSPLTQGSSGVTYTQPTVAQPAGGGLFDKIASLVTSITPLVQMGMSYRQASKVSKINLKRLDEGKPLLTPSQLAPAMPAATVSIDVAPETRNTVLYAGLGIGAAILVFALISKRK